MTDDVVGVRTQRELEVYLGSVYNNCVVRKGQLDIQFVCANGRRVYSIRDNGFAGLSITFPIKNRSVKGPMTINRIYHYADAYQLLYLSVMQPEKFGADFNEEDIINNPSQFDLLDRVRISSNASWEPIYNLVDIDDELLAYALECMKHDLIREINLSEDSLHIYCYSAACEDYRNSGSSLENCRKTALQQLWNLQYKNRESVKQKVERQPQSQHLVFDRGTYYKDLSPKQRRLFLPCDKCYCSELYCPIIVCAYLEYLLKTGNLSMMLSERLNTRNNYRTPCGPYSFTWEPGGSMENVLRKVSENVFNLANQMLRSEQINVAKELTPNNNVRITSDIELPSRSLYENHKELTFCEMADHIENRMNNNLSGKLIPRTNRVTDELNLENLRLSNQIYWCAAYVKYLRDCGKEDLIAQDRLWYQEHRDSIEQQMKTEFKYELPKDQFMNEPDDLFKLAERLQEENFVSIENDTFISERGECNLIVFAEGINCPLEQVEDLKMGLDQHSHSPTYTASLVKYGALPESDYKYKKQVLLAGYIDYLRRQGLYEDYTQRRLMHQEKITSQIATTTSENPKMEKVLAIARNEADSSLYCIIEGERGAGQDDIIQQIASYLAQNGKLPKTTKPTRITFDRLSAYTGYCDHYQGATWNEPFMTYNTLATENLLVLTGLREFLFQAKMTVSGDGSKYRHMIELLGQYQPKTFVIVLAEENEIQPFLELSPQIRFLFGDNIIPIQNLSPEQMYDIFSETLSDELTMQMEQTPDFKNEVLTYIALNRNLLPLKNRELAQYIGEYVNNQKALILPPDVYRTKSAEQMLSSVIGMQNVKDKVREFEKYAVYLKMAESEGMNLPNSHMHMVFLGNPGTGKTMIARIMAELLFSIGVVKTNKFIEAERKDLIGQYMGHTAQKTTEVIEKAMDGVLFIDEAYSLTPKTSYDFGEEAIATLIKAMEDHRDRLVVIFAGYEKEMHDFLTANPGLVSRVGYTFEFADYSADDLVEMFKLKMGAAGAEYTSEEEVFKKVRDLCEHFSEQKDFGNGRFVDRLIQSVIMRHSQRNSDEGVCCFSAEDIPEINEMVSTDSREYRDYNEQLDKFIGMENVKERIKKFAGYVDFIQRAKKNGSKIPSGNLHMIFTGNPGTGKTTIARIMSDMLFSIGAIPTHKFIEVERKDLIAEYVGQTAVKTGAVIDRALGGVLFIDEAYTLTPHSASDFGGEAIATLIKAMEDNKNNLVVIFAGYKEEMRKFKDANPGIASRIGYTFEFDDYSPEELLAIFYKKIESAKLSVEEDAKDKILLLFEYFTKQKNFGNGRFVDRLIQEIIMKHSDDVDDETKLLTICAKDIPEITELTETKSTTSDLDGMESVVGMDLVKERLKEFERFVQFGIKARDVGMTIPDFNMHMLFTGNPGTGKTMVARIIAQRLYDIGLIKTNNFVEVEKKDLISQYIGETSQKTADVIDRAMGGILFIDEAYSLTPQSGEDHSAEAIATLIKAMEDNKDNFIVIFAGYKEEMRQFINSNPGISSRIGFKFEFKDYTPDELTEIFTRKMTANNFHVYDDARDKVRTVLEYFTKQKNFGNGRFVDKLVQEIIMRHSLIFTNDADLAEIHADDIPEITDMTDTVKNVSAGLSLDSVVGMDAVKKQMEEFEQMVEFQLEANDSGLVVPDFNMHMLFTGNPGTGKTMVARIIAQRLFDIGVIKTNTFVEVERKDLVAEWIGQTAVKTADVIDRAMGGVLFIDEAYTLSIPDSARDFGPEAIATLIKAMEDNKDNFIVIFAGYKEEMSRFVDSNPGIASRIGFTFEFEDYTPEELRKIFLRKVEDSGYSVDEEASKAVLELMKQFSGDKNFGNGRFVERVIQKTFQLHVGNYKKGKCDLATFIREDIPDGEDIRSSMAVS